MAAQSYDRLEGVIWYDGKLVPWKEANVHVLSHGLHYASCVFEGERAYGGQVFKSTEHAERLKRSANLLDFEIPYSVAEIVAAKKLVVDIYHGVKVTDDYRWLENDSDPAVKAWSDAQNTAARRFLDAIPTRAALFTQLSDLHRNPASYWSSITYRGVALFALKSQPPKEQPLLVYLRSADEPGSAFSREVARQSTSVRSTEPLPPLAST